MKINKVDHVFFDLDHTLWDFDKNSALTFEKIFEMNQIDLNLSEFLEIYVPRNLYYWKLYREDKIDKQSLRFKRLDDVFKQLGAKVKTRMIYKLSEDYIAHLSNYNHLFEGTIEILDYLKPNYKLHIITNGFKEVQYGKLNNANIIHYFETVTNSEMVGVKKPNPKIFNHALDQARARPDNSLMIGDNYEADILGALQLGFDAICFNYHKDPLVNGVKYVDNLIDLKRYL
ncbi:MAG: YjjG family noncanonical pyrimidine nucleotidase [Bacteroidia bacterium]|nr:YjjG family noncanonical pyrimidine nucleotidase [Bacteroidia bacterium]NND52177.1 noncanonical pyrimidine nucleotidase, YjjG family [Flavobacteriaceae bacterium]